MFKDFVLFQYCSYVHSRAHFYSFYVFPSTQTCVWPMTMYDISEKLLDRWLQNAANRQESSIIDQWFKNTLYMSVNTHFVSRPFYIFSSFSSILHVPIFC